MVEGLFSVLDDPRPVAVKSVGESGKEIVTLEFEDGLKATLHLFMDIAPTFQISLFGQNGWRLIDIKNSYSMFRDNIIEFVRSVEEGASRISFDKTEAIILTLLAAAESSRKGGETITL